MTRSIKWYPKFRNQKWNDHLLPLIQLKFFLWGKKTEKKSKEYFIKRKNIKSKFSTVKRISSEREDSISSFPAPAFKGDLKMIKWLNLSWRQLKEVAKELSYGCEDRQVLLTSDLGSMVVMVWVQSIALKIVNLWCGISYISHSEKAVYDILRKSAFV